MKIVQIKSPKPTLSGTFQTTNVFLALQSYAVSLP
jgi:hypothetical protein